MKSKFLLGFLITFVLFSTVNLVGNNTYAASKVDMDLDFDDVNGITDSEGRDWIEHEGTVSYSVNRMRLDSGSVVSNSTVPNFENQFNAQKDFYVESTFSFMSFNNTDPYINIFDMGNNGTDLSLRYVHSDKQFYAVVKSGITQYFLVFADVYNFELNKDYTVVLSRIGSELVLFVDGVASTPRTIPAIVEMDPASFVYLGHSHLEYYSNLSFLDFKMVSDSTYTGGSSPGDGSSHNTEVTITGGILEAQSSSLILNNVEFNSDLIQKTTGSSVLTVSDNRTTGAGWNVKISATDFKTTLSDPSGGSGNITVSLPASSLSVDPNNLISLSGQDDESISSVANAPLSNLGTNLISAAAGYGMGKYSLDLDFTLSIPKTVKVTNVSGTGSKYIVGDFIGIPKGTYSSTLTYTIGTGL